MGSSSRAHPHSVPRHHPEESEADAVITQRCLRQGVTLVNASGEEVFDLELVKVAVAAVRNVDFVFALIFTYEPFKATVADTLRAR
jgi:hypothetical protein